RSLDVVNSTQTWVELRLAEVYLIRAEANYRLNNEGLALNDINAVRDRVDLPPLGDLSGTAIFDAIRQERKVELSYEGHLYWDMRRWKLAHIDYNNYRVHGIRITKDSSPSGFLFEYVDSDLQNRLFLPKTYVLPIPQSEFANNSAIEQYDEWK